MIECPNCGTKIEEEEARICYRHNKEYCCWCAEDKEGNCSYAGCKVGVNDGIPF